MSDLYEDVLEIAQALRIPPSHTVQFFPLTDGTSFLRDEIYANRVVDARDIHSIGDRLQGNLFNDLRETAVVTSTVSSAHNWESDLQSISTAYTVLSGQGTTVYDVVDTAAITSSADGLYPETIITDLAVTFSALSGENDGAYDITEDAAAIDRVKLNVAVSTLDTATATSTLDAINLVRADTTDTVLYTTTVSSYNIRISSLTDTARGTSQLSAHTAAMADLISNAFVFSHVSSTDTVVHQGIPDQPADALLLSPLYKTTTGWTCNTHNFAMSMYDGDLNSSEFNGIITTGRQHFGSHKTKRISRAYLELSCQSPPTLTVQADGRGALSVHTYEVRVPESGIGPETQRVVLGRGAAGDRWAFQFEGAAPFKLEQIKLAVTGGNISHG